MLRKQFRGLASQMKIHFEDITSQIAHGGDRGISREEHVRSFLMGRLPKRFSVGNGEVMATTGERSRQMDIVVYDTFYCPLLYSSDTSQVFPSESVYAAIEVKSVLNKEELKDCVKKVESVKKLPKMPGRIPLSPTVSSGGQTTPTIGGVFAFSSSTSLQTLLNNLKEFNSGIEMEDQIDIITVLDNGLIINISPDKKMLMHATPTSKLAGIYTNEDTLLMFYLLLIDSLNNSAVVPPNLMTYTQAYALSFKYEVDT